MKVLFYDENLIEMTRLTNTLAKRDDKGFDCRFASDGKSFQEHFKAFGPQIVVFQADTTSEMALKINGLLGQKFPHIYRYLLKNPKAIRDNADFLKAPWNGHGFLPAPFSVSLMNEIIIALSVIPKKEKAAT